MCLLELLNDVLQIQSKVDNNTAKVEGCSQFKRIVSSQLYETRDTIDKRRQIMMFRKVILEGNNMNSKIYSI